MIQADSSLPTSTEKSPYHFGTWYPIETAPKMTAVLLYDCGYVVGHFNTTNNKWWTYSDGTLTTAEALLNRRGPTHWMPLPPPPSNGDREVEPKSTGEE